MTWKVAPTPLSAFHNQLSLFAFVGINLRTIMAISKDRVKPSPIPDNWKLREIIATGVVLGSYLALMTVFFFWATIDTDFFFRYSSTIEFILVNTSIHHIISKKGRTSPVFHSFSSLGYSLSLAQCNWSYQIIVFDTKSIKHVFSFDAG